jgi:hypothetical protein
MGKQLSDDEKIAKKRNELRQLENHQRIADLAIANKSANWDAFGIALSNLRDAHAEAEPVK